MGEVSRFEAFLEAAKRHLLAQFTAADSEKVAQTPALLISKNQSRKKKYSKVS